MLWEFSFCSPRMTIRGTGWIVIQPEHKWIT